MYNWQMKDLDYLDDISQLVIFSKRDSYLEINTGSKVIEDNKVRLV